MSRSMQDLINRLYDLNNREKWKRLAIAVGMVPAAFAMLFNVRILRWFGVEDVETFVEFALNVGWWMGFALLVFILAHFVSLYRYTKRQELKEQVQLQLAGVTEEVEVENQIPQKRREQILFAPAD